MDISDTRSNLSLRFNVHSISDKHEAYGPVRTPIADDSIYFQLDSSFSNDQSSNSASSIPLQLLEQSDYGNCVEDTEVEEQTEEEFSILGYPMCLKRRREREGSVVSAQKRQQHESCSPSPMDLEARRMAIRAWGKQPLATIDPDLWALMEKEKQRQWKGIQRVSENFVCQAVLEALGSHLTNKYSEGLPGSRYYGGNQFIDQIELLCCERALAAFYLDSEKWGVNVQAYLCTSANFAVYTGLIFPKDRIMGLDSPSGGHSSNGYYTPGGKSVFGAWIFFKKTK
ncbi:hypothetical protein AMTR_s00095p00053900 [Amborella trichopoda]|uniref:Serine hydroxymethyltransferase-like domain-containing protein n=1 Tax=Amborella trichopoda TaxID=13333 RepID=W1NT45_AMBTC|nr:hypothetical protein AMTR_s00095p00053900 [Amborella trichopoda]